MNIIMKYYMVELVVTWWWVRTLAWTK